MDPEKPGNIRKHSFSSRLGPMKAASFRTGVRLWGEGKGELGKCRQPYQACTAALWEGEVREDLGAWGTVERKGKWR